MLTEDLLVVLPEIGLVGLACFVLLVDVYLPQSQRSVSYSLSQLGLILVGIVILSNWPTQTVQAFGGSFTVDVLAALLKLSMLVAVLIAFVYAKPYLVEQGIFQGEYFVLGICGLLGMMIMASAGSLLSLYLGLELLSLCLYAMVALQRDSARAGEAAVKYFVLGALASGLLLYGISLIYGVTGSLLLNEITRSLVEVDSGNLALLFGMALLIIGLAFKFGAAPFHMWLPDVYQGAPTSVTLYIASAPKLAAFALVMRLVIEGLAPLQNNWQQMFVVLSVLSLCIGNIVAIAQTNLKRMLGYSAIAHVGFIFLGIIAGTSDGYAAAMFYAIVYAMTSLAAFGILIVLSSRGFEAEQLKDLQGLNQHSPWFALIMAMVLFSMAGVPPFVGFYAKLAVLRAVVQADFIWLAVVAVLLSVVGAFYYLRAIKLMYFDQWSGEPTVNPDGGARVFLSLNGLAVLAFGIYPTGLMSLCLMAVR